MFSIKIILRSLTFSFSFCLFFFFFFLAQAHKTLYNQANAETRYFVKKKTLLALSKLALLASDLPEEQISKHVDGEVLLFW